MGEEGCGVGGEREAALELSVPEGFLAEVIAGEEQRRFSGVVDGQGEGETKARGKPAAVAEVSVQQRSGAGRAGLGAA